MSFLPIAIIAYALNGASTVINKILLSKELPNPIVYVFYTNILGLLALFLLPFGIIIERQSFLLAILSGVIFVFAIYAYFQSLKLGEASVVAPIVGGLTPFFTLIIGWLFLNQILTSQQLIAFFVLIFGAFILTINLWFKKIKLNQQLTLMIVSGFLFALHYILLRDAFLLSNFVTGLFFSRLSAGLLVLLLLLNSSVRQAIFTSKINSHHFINQTSLLLIAGQIMGGLFGLLINLAVFLANPAIVNSLFGVQYLVILAAAIFLAKNSPHLLEEKLSGFILVQKVLGAIVLSIGVWLLTK